MVSELIALEESERAASQSLGVEVGGEGEELEVRILVRVERWGEMRTGEGGEGEGAYGWRCWGARCAWVKVGGDAYGWRR